MIFYLEKIVTDYKLMQSEQFDTIIKLFESKIILNRGHVPVNVRKVKRNKSKICVVPQER